MINILDYLDYTAAHTPDRVAFAGETSAMTFGELQAAARGIGTLLCRHGVYKQPVAVYMEKTPATVAAFMGVVSGGCYYVPLDADSPMFRVRMILETLRPAVILCDEKTAASIPPISSAAGSGLSVVRFAEAAAAPPDGVLLQAVRDKAIDMDPVYVVFTSGSTGTPKGVIASHRSVIDYVEQLCRVCRFGADTVFGSQTPFYVDACLKEIFPTLKYGARTVIIPKQLFMFPVKLMDYLVEKQINTICWVVSALTIVSGFGALAEHAPHTLKLVAFGSEVFPVKQFNRWRAALPNTRFVHLYGPTEATGMSAWYEADRDFAEDEPIPIGRPFANTDILLLTDGGAEPPPGETGEICIRGAGLCLGYFADPEKTAAAFTQNPLSAFPDRIYKTGDLGCRNPHGELVYLGRRDAQIKHMGHRVELAEVEWVAARHEAVRQACVVYDDRTDRIVLYYAAEGALTRAAMAAYCKENLPRYMCPAVYVPLDMLPQTPNGKVDRVGLLAMYREA